jgi:hypothetical protein
MRGSMARLAFASFVCLMAFALAASAQQQGRRQDGARERQMTQEERQRMRDDVRDAYRQRQERPNPAGQRQARQQQMSPEERGRLRRDIEDANRDLKR